MDSSRTTKPVRFTWDVRIDLAREVLLEMVRRVPLQLEGRELFPKAQLAFEAWSLVLEFEREALNVYKTTHPHSGDPE